MLAPRATSSGGVAVVVAKKRSSGAQRVADEMNVTDRVGINGTEAQHGRRNNNRPGDAAAAFAITQITNRHAAAVWSSATL
jgi:hypothetical protein